MAEIIPLLSNGIDSNCYLVLDDKNAIIDTGSGLGGWLIRTVKHEIHPDKVSIVINTHGHADHCGGNGLFKNAEVMAHVLETREMQCGNLYGTAGLLGGVEPCKIHVDRKLRDGDTIELGSLILRVLHTPGHTPGSICLFEEKRGILFSGDTLFSGGGFGRVDLGGKPGEMLHSLRRLSGLDFTRLLPGHGGIGKKGREEAKMALRYAEELLL
jgi:glyoxylase-like metal-dependent hydrolase (beta-lactamase superfamily II)